MVGKNRFSRDETGTSVVEYALLLSLVGVAMLGSLSTIGRESGETFSVVADAMDVPAGGPPPVGDPPNIAPNLDSPDVANIGP